MAVEVDFLPVATGAGANVDTQANFAGSGYQVNGMQPGIAQPAQANKCWRQSSVMAAAIAWFISNVLNIDVLDDGDRAGLTTNFTNAVEAVARTGTRRVVTLAFSATPVFDASQGDSFEMVMTGNVTSSTLINTTPGQRIKIVLTQDATGGRTFVPPAGVNFPNIDTAPSKINMQNIYINAAGNPLIDGPLTVN